MDASSNSTVHSHTIILFDKELFYIIKGGIDSSTGCECGDITILRILIYWLRAIADLKKMIQKMMVIVWISSSVSWIMIKVADLRVVGLIYGTWACFKMSKKGFKKFVIFFWIFINKFNLRRPIIFSIFSWMLHFFSA